MPMIRRKLLAALLQSRGRWTSDAMAMVARSILREARVSERTSRLFLRRGIIQSSCSLGEPKVK
eukprot:scaffold3912_cov80-Cyclotella_meneghiniana.AAC.3